jgi:hypothetical protein
MPFAIYPPIGLARIGNSPDSFFIGREEPDTLGVEIAADGAERPVTHFKDEQHRVRRQAARFRIFDVSDPSAPVEAELPAGSLVRWSVGLANRKDSVRRPGSPPSSPVAIVDDTARADRAISAAGTVTGPNAARATLDGAYLGTGVRLGELGTDERQRLVVLGGLGTSATLSNPASPIGGSFYNNPDWYDDVGDGPVTAIVEVPGREPEQARGAWLIIAPPDFAPPSNGVVTLYDVVRQVAIEQNWLPAPVRPFFESDIRPMIARAASLRHVDGGETWSLISQDWSALSDPTETARALRSETATLVREVENALHDFELRSWQIDALLAWEAGNFEPGAAPDRGLCDRLTRAALDGGVGQGFFPGIEAGVNIMDPARYESAAFEYRLSHEACLAGDFTALMALPWQADFLKCGENWWPAQRPYRVLTEDGAHRPWLRPWMDHRRLVGDAMRLGILTPDGGKVVERGRDPVLGQ